MTQTARGRLGRIGPLSEIGTFFGGRGTSVPRVAVVFGTFLGGLTSPARLFGCDLAALGPLGETASRRQTKAELTFEGTTP